MNGRFTITVDRARGLLIIVLGGFFSIGDIDDYLIAKMGALLELGCRPNRHLTLCDVSGFELQSQEVVNAFKKSLDDPRYMARRIAFVVGTALARMQVRRILTRPEAACFDSIDDAEDWLFREDPAPSSPA